MRRRLIVQRRAEIDVATIYLWIAERSKDGADRWYRAYREAIARIRDRSDELPLAYEHGDIEGWTLREILFKTRRGRPYRIVFTIVDRDAYVLRVRAPGQADLQEEDLPPLI